MNLEIRKATENDIPAIATLAEKIWREHYPSIITQQQIDFMLASRYSADVLHKQFQTAEKFYLVFLNHMPVAYASIEERADYFYLHKFYIDVSEHRSGIGSELFNFLLKETGSKKIIRLQVNRKNYKAINFYFKKGFVIEAVGDFDIGGGYFMNDFVMIRGTDK